MDTVTLCVHWPARHVTPEGITKLRTTLDQHTHPEGEPVLLVLAAEETYWLGLNVTPSKALAHELAAVDAPWVMSHLLGEPPL